MGFWDVVGLIIAGAIIGALARLFLPGKQNIGCLVTVCVGVVGCLIGYWIGDDWFDDDDNDGLFGR